MMNTDLKNNYVIIMAGGVGSRFWPMSNASFPKQFQDILGTGKSMIQQTADRFKGICTDENIYVVTNASYVELVKQQLPQLEDEQILGEPVGKNTAPCVAYAAYKIYSKNSEANLVVTPADHVVLKEEEFGRKISQALECTSKSNALLTLGIKPSRPDTGYGYIKYNQSENEIKAVNRFTEKPNLENAKEFVDSGEYLWNAGIFIWNAKAIISEFEKHLNTIHLMFSSNLWFSKEENKLVEDVYAKCESISIDYGILEKSDDVRVIECDFGWSDLGTWNSLYSVAEKDIDGNVLHGNIKTYDSSGNMIKSVSDKKIVVQGLENFIVVDTDDALMICERSREQLVKKFVIDLKL